MSTFSTNNTITATSLAATDLPLSHGVAIGSKWPALMAVALGAIIVFGVGFSSLSVAHNAAHDTRHTLVFPCH